MRAIDPDSGAAGEVCMSELRAGGRHEADVVAFLATLSQRKQDFTPVVRKILGDNT